MKKLFLIVALLLSYTGQLSAVLEYRRATANDVNHMLALIELFDAADTRQLAIPPEIAREAWLLEEIQKNHFFVACDSAEAENPIVGFCKIYLVAPDDVLTITGEELGATKLNSFNFLMKKPHCNFMYKITSIQADDFIHPINPIGQAPRCQLSPNDIYIYLGTNYTRLSHRGRGINTQLEQEIFTIIRDEILDALTPESSIYYMFGVVEENWGKQTRLRSFAKFAQSLLPRMRRTVPVYISFTAFSTVKPTLIIDEAHSGGGSPRIVMSPRGHEGPRSSPDFQPAGIPGFGCFLGFTIPPRYIHEVVG